MDFYVKQNTNHLFENCFESTSQENLTQTHPRLLFFHSTAMSRD